MVWEALNFIMQAGLDFYGARNRLFISFYEIALFMVSLVSNNQLGLYHHFHRNLVILGHHGLLSNRVDHVVPKIIDYYVIHTVEKNWQYCHLRRYVANNKIFRSKIKKSVSVLKDVITWIVLQFNREFYNSWNEVKI